MIGTLVVAKIFFPKTWVSRTTLLDNVVRDTTGRGMNSVVRDTIDYFRQSHPLTTVQTIHHHPWIHEIRAVYNLLAFPAWNTIANLEYGVSDFRAIALDRRIIDG